MEPTTHIDLTKLLRVLRALHDGIQRNLEYGMHAGTGDTAYKSYVALHARAAAALPDDAYVTEALRVEMAEDVDDGTRLAAVNLALRQLVA
ncbi:MAG: hypothetical protein SGJ24_02125, partial [Chloroflexota bacterium]|nr:hypothetical protein [Chloroflexota bacterium]